MPGTRITDQQVTIYMKHRKRNSQIIAAAKAGMSEHSARRIDKQDEQPLSNKRQWRTRIDLQDSCHPLVHSIIQEVHPNLMSEGSLQNELNVPNRVKHDHHYQPHHAYCETEPFQKYRHVNQVVSDETDWFTKVFSYFSTNNENNRI